MQKSLTIESESIEDALKQLPDWLSEKESIKTVEKWEYDWVSIGRQVRERRKSTGMSLRSAARWMSVSATYLSDLERGILPWSSARLKDITNVLDMAERTFNK
jgi:hypothetical protein